ncbi:vesicle transport through interaction with t-SNAREs homolog 1A-like isoform X1 [Acipenser ruthenus]|uniref:vesicle transport through interaction with t-SNAREs homolog 1A-like isoform X1 n=1 Tax=Acipenser ruthenus TaxID=7906 RepID=UPI002740D26A|nr:vesicle transport through interaction with t-SNAREs homolog 1A-like isoform X1 [Acipenser ruthenus]
MSSDFETYEQDFGTLTAEITSRIVKIPKLAGVCSDGNDPEDEKKNMVVSVEKQLEEARELLEQMDLEVREIPVQSRGMHSTRLKSYKQELEKLEKDFVSPLCICACLIITTLGTIFSDELFHASITPVPPLDVTV